MKTRTILLGSAAIAVAAVAAMPAQAAHFHGWYVGIEAGANWVKDWDFTSATTSLPAHTHFDKADIDPGWAVLATVGYAINSWRFEIEPGYRENDADFRTSRSGAVNTVTGGEVRELSLMANVHYDIALTDRLMFSLGAGAGADKVKIDFNQTPPLSGANIDSWEFAYQGIAGLSYAIGRGTDLTLNYRYFHADAPDLDFGPFSGHAFTNTEDIEKQTVTIGLRFDLTRDSEPVSPPDPVARAPEPPPATSFVVFFAYNKCNITAEADHVLGEAASAAQSRGQARVIIVGHTDTSGSARYNQKLSMCRANAAASNLVSKGVPHGAISASGKGETELLVQTADGVKEPQNRRATVDID